MVADHEEIQRFQGLWQGGYYEGDPLNPVTESSYGELGYISVLHAVYQACVRPYIDSETVVVEIGPGRGAWTKTLLPAKEIWCLDAVSAEDNHFWDYVGTEHKEKVHYLQAQDFSCRDLPDDYFHFLFSFGVFCHITWEGQCEYYRNLFPKMQAGAMGMVMISDFDKYNAAVRNLNQLRVRRVGPDPILHCLNDAAGYVEQFRRGRNSLYGNWVELDKNDHSTTPGRWYHAGVQETCEMLESIGWEVLEPDVGLCLRDPIVCFRKPLWS